jgi:hypothetical protein
MSTEIIVTQGTGLLSTDTTKFEAYLAHLGLPTENIIAGLPERQIIENNLPALVIPPFLTTLQKRIKKIENIVKT